MRPRVTIVLGLQWGDEGKGKILDVMASEADWVLRAQGGNNAGHTVEIGGEKFVLHLVPSGILRAKVSCLIAGGAVVDPAGLVREIEGLARRKIRTQGRLFLAEQAHLVLPQHRAVDQGSEKKRGLAKIGTTGRGIGPAYSDKATRVGLRAGEMALPAAELARRLRERVMAHNRVAGSQGWEKISATKTVREIEKAARFLRPYLADGVTLAHRAVAGGKRILIEGAQGTFLDVDHGTYPFVTSSHCTAGGACTGTGVPPTAIQRVVGVLKAYTTRVGGGPFVTEDGTLGHLLHGMGREFGSTTGRARRCGWFDAVLVRRAVQLKKVGVFPGCTYCQPQVASIGLTEAAAKEKKLKFKVGRFPYRASGRAVASGDSEGMVKREVDAIVDRINQRLGDRKNPVITRGSMGSKHSPQRWRMKSGQRSPAYTTSWRDLPVAVLGGGSRRV